MLFRSSFVLSNRTEILGTVVSRASARAGSSASTHLARPPRGRASRAGREKLQGQPSPPQDYSQNLMRPSRRESVENRQGRSSTATYASQQDRRAAHAGQAGAADSTAESGSSWYRRFSLIYWEAKTVVELLPPAPVHSGAGGAESQAVLNTSRGVGRESLCAESRFLARHVRG